jgi:hypothetical protein
MFSAQHSVAMMPVDDLSIMRRSPLPLASG